MGYTIRSQVFFTRNYENVSEIYEDLTNVRNWLNLWEYLTNLLFHGFVSFRSLVGKNFLAVKLVNLLKKIFDNIWRLNNNDLKYSILDMIPPPRMEIREVLVELQSTVSNKWPARPTRMQSWQSSSIMSGNRRCRWARVCCFCEIAGAMRPSILELESLVMPVNLGFFFCLFSLFVDDTTCMPLTSSQSPY